MEEDQLGTLVELVEKFLVHAKTLLKEGIIDQEVFNKITENKIKFLESYKAKLNS